MMDELPATVLVVNCVGTHCLADPVNANVKKVWQKGLAVDFRWFDWLGVFLKKTPAS